MQTNLITTYSSNLEYLQYGYRNDKTAFDNDIVVYVTEAFESENFYDIEEYSVQFKLRGVCEDTAILEPIKIDYDSYWDEYDDWDWNDEGYDTFIEYLLGYGHINVPISSVELYSINGNTVNNETTNRSLDLFNNMHIPMTKGIRTMNCYRVSNKYSLL